MSYSIHLSLFLKKSSQHSVLKSQIYYHDMFPQRNRNYEAFSTKKNYHQNQKMCHLTIFQLCPILLAKIISLVSQHNFSFAIYFLLKYSWFLSPRSRTGAMDGWCPKARRKLSSKIIGRGKESQVILCVKQGDLLHTDGILIHVSLAAQETLMTWFYDYDYTAAFLITTIFQIPSLPSPLLSNTLLSCRQSMETFVIMD